MTKAELRERSLPMTRNAAFLFRFIGTGGLAGSGSWATAPIYPYHSTCLELSIKKDRKLDRLIEGKREPALNKKRL